MATDLQAEVETLSAQLKALTKRVDAQKHEETRRKLLEVTMEATAQLESPMEICWRIMMSPHAPSALMTLIKMGAIDLLVETGEALSAQTIAEKTGAETLLVVRLVRPLIALGIIKEKGEDLYESTDTAKLLTTPIVKGGYIFMYTTVFDTIPKMPFHLASTSYRNPTSNPGPFQMAKGTSDDIFSWMLKRPELMTHFNNFMIGQQGNRGDWFDRLDVEDLIFKGAQKDGDGTFLIDIGGGGGHDINAFAKRFKTVPGKLVLQDLPEVVLEAKGLDPRIEKMEYDFFTEQPVRGARTYYLRSILHDWSDEKCLEILARIREAMTPCYSKLLLNEFVLPSKGVPFYPSVLDIHMMACFNSMERTKKQWTALLDKAGFQIIEIHVEPSGEKEGIIEAELKV